MFSLLRARALKHIKDEADVSRLWRIPKMVLHWNAQHFFVKIKVATENFSEAAMLKRIIFSKNDSG